MKVRILETMRERALIVSDRLGVRVHVDVASAIAGLGIGETVVLAGWRRETLGQWIVEFGRPRRRSPRDVVRPIRTGRDDDVAVIDLLGELEAAADEFRLRDAELKISGVVAQHHEDQLADITMLDHATCDENPGTIIDRLDGVVLLASGDGTGVRLVRGLVEETPCFVQRDQSVDSFTEGVQFEFIADPGELRAASRDQGTLIGFRLLILHGWFFALGHASMVRRQRRTRGASPYKNAIAVPERRDVHSTGVDDGSSSSAVLRPLASTRWRRPSA